MPTAPSRIDRRVSRAGATSRIAATFASALLSACLSACGTTPAPIPRGVDDASNACAGWTVADFASARVVRRVRVYTDPATGDSAIEETTYAPKSTPLFKTGTILREYDFGPASKVQIVVGPPDFDIPLHPAPYRESFLILKGSVRMKLGDGRERDLVPGDMTVFEDTTSSRGHGGRTGPCGYVSLDLVP